MLKQGMVKQENVDFTGGQAIGLISPSFLWDGDLLQCAQSTCLAVLNLPEHEMSDAIVTRENGMGAAGKRQLIKPLDTGKAQNNLLMYNSPGNANGKVLLDGRILGFSAGQNSDNCFGVRRRDSDVVETRHARMHRRILPSVGAFTVQCALCLKWRLVPTKELYEEIRQCILEKPWVCEYASSWRSNASCKQPTDLSQDMSQLWAIDKPNIPCAPPGWKRLLVIRGAGSTKFADIYYEEPSGKRLRSLPEVKRFLEDNSKYENAGVHIGQFSFMTPSPLDESYVRKKPRTRMSYTNNTVRHREMKQPYSKPSCTTSHTEGLALRRSLSQQAFPRALTFTNQVCEDNTENLAAGLYGS